MIELIIVVLVMLILLTLTVAVVGNLLDADRVSGAATQVRNYLAGGRDRAIYAASRTPDEDVPPLIGVRFLSDPSLQVTVPDGPDLGTEDDVVHRGFSSMVYVQQIDPVTATLRMWPVDSGADAGQWRASQLDPTTGNPYPGAVPFTRVGELINSGFIASRVEPSNPHPGHPNDLRAYYLPVTLVDDESAKRIFLRFHKSDINGAGWLMEGELSAKPPLVNATGPPGAAYPVLFHLRPVPLPNEEPRLLPEGTIVEIQSSRVGGLPLSSWMRGETSFDVMFNAQGVVAGPLASAGLIHLVVADLEDIERGFGLNSPFLDSDSDPTNGIQPLDADGDGKPDVRQGQVRIISLRTRTGSGYVSDLNPVVNAANGYKDPFKYAETGGEANL